ncbi:2-hydroxyacid dehydrogenase [Salirhabdus salicampi]|uniref:2-hydroxyacid dehydrogenase n=1 Tax=Salirhabdus salicampi TaxID=476102 RepID=UPI0020C24364|nr:D-glycerate dehydrogenase [Salirhabdus salicampi]MCP8617756.1 D-glycerate dehydrogenase [Salirhabdus salicampi]
MSKPYVYITRKIPEEVLEPYKNDWDFHVWPYEETPVDSGTLQREIEKADGLFTTLPDRIDRETIDKAKNLKVIANLAVGFDNIDVEYAKEKGIVVANTPDVLTETTADLTFGLLMASARRLVEANRYVVEGKWKEWSPLLLAGTDVYGKTIGIVGMGRIGEAVARRAKGFNMDVLYYNRSRKPGAEAELEAQYTSFDDLLKQSDYVVCLTPLTPETKDLFNREAFQKMKNSAIFVNASRGATVDEDALYDALKNGDITAAGLDVFREEPVDPSHPLLTLSNVTALPHIGSASYETRYTMMKLTLENIQLVLQGKAAKTPV